MNFTWEVIELQQNKMYVQLDFESPLNISSHNQRDKLKMKVIDPKILIASDSFVRIRNLTTSENDIPPQLLEGILPEYLETG